MKRILFLTLLLHGTLQGLLAQPGTLKGTIFTQPDSTVLPNANVALFPLGVGDETDENGFFTIIEIPDGAYQMVVSHVGYQDYSRKVIIHKGQTVTTDAYLESKPRQLQEVVVSSERDDTKPYRIDRINLETLRETPVMDIGMVLRETPNISAIRKGGTNLDPVIRGFRSGQLNVQLNSGTKIEGGCPNRMDPASSHVDINDVREIRVYKGPYALRFGPVLGGILRISTISVPSYTRFETHVTAIQTVESNWNGSRSHLGIRGGNQYFFFDLSGNYNTFGNYTAGNGDEIPSRFTKYNYTARLGFTPGKNQVVSVLFDRSYGRNVLFPALPMDERSDDTRILSLEYEGQRPGKKWESIEISAYHSLVDHVMDNKERPFSDTVVAVSTVSAINFGYRAEAGFRFGRHQVNVGTDFERILKDGIRVKNLIRQPNLPEKREPLWDDAVITNTGIFAGYTIPLGRVELSVATRFDFNAATCRSMSFYGMNGQLIFDVPDVRSNFLNLSISAGAHYIITDAVSLDLAIGRSTRSPDMVERFIMLLPIGYDDYDYIGNPQLKPEINNQADLTATYTCINSGNYTANLFFSVVENYITGKELPPSVVKPQTQGVLGVKQFINTDYVYLYGFEFTFSSPDAWKLGATAVASLTRGINPSATHYIVQNGQVTGEESVKNDPLAEIPPLEGGVKIYYKFLKSRLIPAISLRFVAPQNQVSVAYDESTTPGFATAGVSLKFTYNHYLTLTAGAENIFNSAYYEHLNRRITGSDLPLYEPGRIFYASLLFTL